MIILSTAADILRIATSAASALDAQASFVDSGAGYFQPGRQNTAISSIATTTILSAVGSSLTRALKALSVNARGGANTVTVEYFDGTTAFRLVSVALASGETLEYEDAFGWRVLTVDGAMKGIGPQGATGTTGATGATGPAANPTQSHVGWAPTVSGQTSNLLTLLAAGHAAGLYLVAISQLVRTLTTGGASGQETLTWSNGGAQSVSTGTGATSSPRWGVLGLAYGVPGALQNHQYPRFIYSDGISAITAQVTVVGGTPVAPVIDISASACRIGT
jgi:hypothetical protein